MDTHVIPATAAHAALAGKSAIVTGSTSGIGLGVARALGLKFTVTPASGPAE